MLFKIMTCIYYQCKMITYNINTDKDNFYLHRSRAKLIF